MKGLTLGKAGYRYSDGTFGDSAGVLEDDVPYVSEAALSLRTDAGVRTKTTRRRSGNAVEKGSLQYRTVVPWTLCEPC